jgi:hypothetical protein
MGWTCLYSPPCDERAEIENLVTCENEDRAMRPILTIRKGTVWYLAVEVTLKAANQKSFDYEVDGLGRYVFAAVILTSRNNGEWCYKDMEETMGPCEAQAPLKLLNLLSETTREYAISWRERCKSYAAITSRKISHGDIIRLAQPIEFTDGVERSLFKVQRERFAGAKRQTTYFVCSETGLNFDPINMCDLGC